MKIKIDKADKVFSEFIRRRDGRCVKCESTGDGPLGIVGLQCSHYFGRRSESTRFDPENCDALCFGCHQIWGSDDREGYRAFKIKQLGERGFKLLMVRNNTYQRKDRKMSLIVAQQLIKTLEN